MKLHSPAKKTCSTVITDRVPATMAQLMKETGCITPPILSAFQPTFIIWQFNNLSKPAYLVLRERQDGWNYCGLCLSLSTDRILSEIKFFSSLLQFFLYCNNLYTFYFVFCIHHHFEQKDKLKYRNIFIHSSPPAFLLVIPSSLLSIQKASFLYQ